jgi:putative tryptophan/tyrosine transport system substrate-binding protein
VVCLMWAVIVATIPVDAQPIKVYRIGFLTPGASHTRADEAFRESLRHLGYSEGQNIFIEWRFTKGDAKQFPAFATEMVRQKVDCIVTRGIPAIRSAKNATGTIPIIMVVNDDPVQMGLVDSLARPGANITGFAAIGAELAGKRLELLKETFPKVTRVGHLWGTLTGAAHLREIEAPARALGVQLRSLEVKGPGDLENAFRTASKESDALVVVGAGWVNVHRDRIIGFANKTRMPVMYTQSPFALEGGLMSYAADETELWSRAAVYVDKVLKGIKPAELPIQQPTKFELVINLKTAKQIGLTIPPHVLARADKVIK